MLFGREESSFARPSGLMGRARVARGFTLIELVVSLTVISVLLTLSVFAFRTLQRGGGMARAKDMLVNYVSVARSYAIANHIETMFVVNPYNSRFEIWHLNPPKEGGPWDPFSGGSAAPFVDGYAYAPILDKSVGLQVDAEGGQLYGVFPIDYDDPVYRLTTNDAEERNIDNLTWAAVCFDEEGRIVTRTRRIATRTIRMRDGSVRPVPANRLVDGTPNLGLLEQSMPEPVVRDLDTAITSTRGFVICDMARIGQAIQSNPTPLELINNLLRNTRASRRYNTMAETVMLDRVSGQPLSGDQK